MANQAWSGGQQQQDRRQRQRPQGTTAAATGGPARLGGNLQRIYLSSPQPVAFEIADCHHIIPEKTSSRRLLLLQILETRPSRVDQTKSFTLPHLRPHDIVDRHPLPAQNDRSCWTLLRSHRPERKWVLGESTAPPVWLRHHSVADSIALVGCTNAIKSGFVRLQSACTNRQTAT